MKQYLICSVVVLASSGVALPAAAQTADASRWYGSLGYTQTQVNGGDVGSIDGRLGDRFTPYFGAEGELSVGVSGDVAPDIGPNSSQRLNAAVAAYGVGFMPLGKNFSLLARVGVGENQFEQNSPGVRTRLDVSSVNYGVGAMFNLNPSNLIRADYTRKSYDQAGLNANTYDLSFVHKF